VVPADRSVSRDSDCTRADRWSPPVSERGKARDAVVWLTSGSHIVGADPQAGLRGREP
jgi:hypothetical protein